MKTKEVKFIVKFHELQDVENRDNDLNAVYATLDTLLQDGVIEDYNCSEMKEEA